MADLNANQAAFKLLTDQALTPAEETELRDKLSIVNGVDEFIALTDKTTADLPTINIPLSSALADKASITQGALADSAIQPGTPTGIDGYLSMWNSGGELTNTDLKEIRIINQLSSGLIKGGEITKNATVGQYDISAGSGQIVDNITDEDNPTVYEVEWGSLIGNTPTNLATQSVTYIFIDNTGNILETSNPPSGISRRLYISLGSVSHTDNVSIGAAINNPDLFTSPVSQVRDVEDAIGLINSGNNISANGANLSINKSVGSLVFNGINFNIDRSEPSKKIYGSSVAPSFRLRTQTGDGATSTTLDVTNYDLLGAVTSITGSKVQNFRFFLTIAGNIVVQYGQTIYANMSVATAALQTEEFVTYPNITENATLIGVASVISSATDLSNTTQAKFYRVGKFGELGGAGIGTSVSTLQQAYFNSINPEIITDSTRGAVTIKRGSGSDTDNIFEGINASDITTFSVTGEGNIGFNHSQFAPVTAPPHSEGLVYYDSSKKALTYYNDEVDVAVNIGQENVITVRNSTGATILNGQAVYINGSLGNNLPTVALAQADTLPTSRCIGLATHDIENNSSGYVTTLGSVGDLNTSSFAAGDPLFLSGDTAGVLTSTRPTTGYAVVVGYCIISSITVGEIKVIPGTTAQLAKNGDAFISGDLSQFSVTTSSQLAGVISDETGTGLLVFSNSPTLTTPALGTPSSGVLTNCIFPTLNQDTIGNAATATALETGRAINGITFDGTAPITITAAAGTLTGTTLNATIVNSSLTSTGTINSGTWQGTPVADAYIASASVWNSLISATTANIQSAGALMDTEVTNLADVKSFDPTDYATPAEAKNETFIIPISPEDAEATAGADKVTFTLPFGLNISSVSASAVEAPTGSSALIQIAKFGFPILSTPITIISGATESSAGTVANSNLLLGDVILVTLDQAGATYGGRGYKVTIRGTRT